MKNVLYIRYREGCCFACRRLCADSQILCSVHKGYMQELKKTAVPVCNDLAIQNFHTSYLRSTAAIRLCWCIVTGMKSNWKEGGRMSQISKETKDLNKTWVSKQQDLHKTYSSYIIGGGVLVVVVLLILLAMMYLWIHAMSAASANTGVKMHLLDHSSRFSYWYGWFAADMKKEIFLCIPIWKHR